MDWLSTVWWDAAAPLRSISLKQRRGAPPSLQRNRGRAVYWCVVALAGLVPRPQAKGYISMLSETVLIQQHHMTLQPLGPGYEARL